MSCLPDDKYLILKVDCSYLFYYAHLEKGEVLHFPKVFLHYLWRLKNMR